MNNFTEEQRAAIDARGKTIVSASAGSGKTTVMIEKIVRLIISGTDVKEILAVTFTKKAAAQMKEKLRKELIKAINSPETSPAVRAALKKQLAEVPSADISTIHSFCSKLIRSHFFAAGVDSDFSVIAEDDADGTKLKNDALDEVFEEAYEKGEENFLRLLSVYWRKKSDNRLRGILFDTYSALRMRADYRTFLTENAAVVVQGKISVRDEKEPQLILNRATPIAEFDGTSRSGGGAAAARPGQKLYLRLESETMPLMRKITAVLHMFPGTMPVILFFSDTRVRRGTTCLPDADLFQELRELLGEENVIIK